MDHDDLARYADLRKVVRFLIPEEVARTTEAFLQSQGRFRQEGWVLWAGGLADTDVRTFVVGRAIVPRQAASGIHAHVAGAEVDRIAKQLEEQNEVLGIQIHSHPWGAFHSGVDDEEALVTKVGGVSIVVPNFARGGLRDFSQCAVYRLTGSGWAGPIDVADTKSLLVVSEGAVL